MMMALVIALPALAGALAAFALRRRLAALGFMTWLGWMMIGAGAPVLLGQVIALGLTDTAAAMAEGCEFAGPDACRTAGLYFVLPLAAGLCAGLGWAAGALSVRFAKAKDTI
ncbi:MAG: hypothetical protein CMH91_14615 [Oceanicaulis sp.]|jgi:hypothetical protein|uniref:hypothetical protein n=2 Tax=Oceanicaulis TaxID=153232 RepID=UPI00006698CD|nr:MULTISPECIES: hypothetical protein [unclassified Oceanicaulis]MAB69598.1 hypothetical protein [Oceanicaulis sp.]EAP89409.1 hypothetical protein OA2633_09094 [Oceanicaulis sp. HTCC2633]MBC40279.1 hypothetical protein [Oceanicaulis sp.]HBU62588.1 hypothetical protein [Oceanicaulis sp.]HCR94760.1 hypothetical protein [Oceanicaulis sp.]